MPKSNYEIETFAVGIVSNPTDERDIPKNAATYSLNIDPLNAAELSAIPKDLYLSPSGFEGTYSEFKSGLGGGTGQNSSSDPAPNNSVYVDSQAGDTSL